MKSSPERRTKVWAKPPTSSRIRCDYCEEQLANCLCMDWDSVYTSHTDES